METLLTKTENNQLLIEIQNIFAQVTRYPLDILDTEANLEEDLGIDSVKLGEVFSVIKDKYNLTQEIDIPEENLMTIKGISGALDQYLSTTSHAESDTQPSPDYLTKIETTSNPVVEQNNITAIKTPVVLDDTNILDDLITVFAEVTRYPLDILDPEADLEEDLGIDSVKLGEIFSVLRQKYDLPTEMDIPEDQLRTISGVSIVLTEYLSNKEVLFPKKVNGFEKKINGTKTNIALKSGEEKEQPILTEQPKKIFTNKIVFISGSGRGLGKDIAISLAALGAQVVVNSFHSREEGIRTASEIEASGGKAYHIWGSMANDKQQQAVFDEIESRFGGLDFFISNASNGMLAKLEDINVEHWEKAFRTNVVGLHMGALRALKLMKKRGGGKIITLSSPAAHGYVDYFGCMGAVKAAVESLTRSMAIEFSPYNVQVNCVSPGPITGDLLKKWPESEKLIAQWESHTVTDRLCEAHDVSHFIAYLLQDDVKLFTGSVLLMDGGISARRW